MKKPFNILNYQTGVKAMIDFKPPTEAEMKEAAEKWHSILAEITASLPPRDYEQDYIQLKAVKYIRYNMKEYFTYAWDETGKNLIFHYLERIGNEIYYSTRTTVQGQDLWTPSTGICHLDNQILLRICKHFLSI